MTFNILAGFLVLFLLYQLGEANGQGLLKFPGKPYSIFGLFLLVIPAAHWVARWQGDSGLAAYGMGFHAGWWKAYLLGMGLGLTVQIPLEGLGIRLGIRQVANLLTLADFFQIGSNAKAMLAAACCKRCWLAL
ncbi:MAG: hypothetical protein Fur0016_28810 [Anaerolineales bacterium]